MVKSPEGGVRVNYLMWGLIGYFIGAIPFSYILPKLKGVDVRKVGSGNVGGTNALRAAGPLFGGLSMLFDTLKALIPTLVAYQTNPNIKVAVATALGTIIGHDFPIYLGFKGGKGVAVTLGAMFVICWQCALVFLGAWFLVVALTYYVSLASLVGLFSAAIFGYFLKGETVGIPILIFAILSLLRHRSNVERLISGRERKTNIWDYVKRNR